MSPCAYEVRVARHRYPGWEIAKGGLAQFRQDPPAIRRREDLPMQKRVSVDKTGAYYGQVEAKIWACFVRDGEEVESAAGNEQMSGR